jgi:hypothetical protein
MIKKIFLKFDFGRFECDSVQLWMTYRKLPPYIKQLIYHLQATNAKRMKFGKYQASKKYWTPKNLVKFGKVSSVSIFKKEYSGLPV